jgi:hypothetical protein
METTNPQTPLYKTSACVWVLASIIAITFFSAIWFVVREVDEPKYLMYFVPIVVAVALLVYYAIIEISRSASKDNGLYN